MNEFRKEDKKVLINVPYAEAYLPVSLFTDSNSALASFIGNSIKVLGFFHMRFFDSEDESEDRDSKQLRTLAYPNSILTCPSSYDVMNLNIDNIEDKYYVLHYYKDDVLMDALSEKTVLNCETYLDALIKAKLPRGLPYQDLLFNWIKNFKINDINPGVKAIVMQLIISANARYAKDPSIPYCKVAAKMDKLNPEDYILFNMNNIAASNSVLSGISFERVSEKLTTGITMSMTGAKQNVSPLEKVMLM